MSVNSFGYNIIDTRVKSLESRSSVSLTNITENVPYGRTYTHLINGPNAPNPNNYHFNISETAPSGNANTDIITVSATGGPPYTNTYLTLKSNIIYIDGWLINTANNTSIGSATIPNGSASVIVPKQNVTVNSIILLTPTNNIDKLWVEAGVPADNQFTIKTDANVAADIKINFNVLFY